MQPWGLAGAIGRPWGARGSNRDAPRAAREGGRASEGLDRVAAGTRGTDWAAAGAIGHPRERAGVIARLGRGGPYMVGVIRRPRERACSHGSERE